jgi:hypothetical protein
MGSNFVSCDLTVAYHPDECRAGHSKFRSCNCRREFTRERLKRQTPTLGDSPKYLPQKNAQLGRHLDRCLLADSSEPGIRGLRNQLTGQSLLAFRHGNCRHGVLPQMLTLTTVSTYIYIRK